MANNSWFSVDKEGLAKILERRGKAFALFELIQNSWDAPGTTRVEVLLESAGRLAALQVIDDAPSGMVDLEHAWTLFAESEKKGQADKRGRFNLGEKLVLAICQQAAIVTVSGSVKFSEDGTRLISRRKTRGAGTLVDVVVKMTAKEVGEALDRCRLLIAPEGIETTINGVVLPPRLRAASFSVSLPTELADAEGVMRPATRTCRVDVYEPLAGEPARVYEMGIPVVETGDRWDLDVQQKVPLSLERDGLPPAFLKALRVATLNAMATRLEGAEASESWVRAAAGDRRAEPEAVRRVLDLRYGESRVAFDPSDREANGNAASAGFAVVHGGSLSAGEWENAKKAQAIVPAGRVFPTHPAATAPTEAVEPTPAMRAFARRVQDIGYRLGLGDVKVDFLSSPEASTLADFTKERNLVRFNVGRLGERWFEGFGPDQLDLVLHEFGQYFASDHLSKAYHEALTRLGANLAFIAAGDPEVLR